MGLRSPRPSKGVIYCGVVEGEFELIDNPSKEEWFKTWEKCWEERWGTPPYEDSTRKISQKDKADLKDAWMAGEIAQTWRVDKFREIQAAQVPVWIRRSLFGRSTYGIVKDQFGLNPYQAMFEILRENFCFEPRSWTKSPAEIQQRLLTDFTPSAFEHLVVALLQLEHPDEIWTHVGGSGDGGVDGMGSDSNGKTIGLLQCKWIYSGEKLELADVWRGAEKGPRRFLASIHHRDDQRGPDGFEFLNKDKIAELLIKHAAKLPQAVTLRVGDAPAGH
ncbi:restriction endonuclease [Hoeflea sp.]|uniref:restriction endonuclease n=1 Tax=Hoeflea sp. TaxID=1940281 RepID=UPI001982D5C7|nr:restriction endonuclease [Hoeflea sp.]MBC7283901.1 restriction endonuclease [Hoeflea sp.]